MHATCLVGTRLNSCYRQSTPGLEHCKWGHTELAPHQYSSSWVVHVSLTFCRECTSLYLYLDEHSCILVSEAILNVANFDCPFPLKYFSLLASGTCSIGSIKKKAAAFGEVKDVAENAASHTNGRSQCVQQGHRARALSLSSAFTFLDFDLCRGPKKVNSLRNMPATHIHLAVTLPPAVPCKKSKAIAVTGRAGL
jgi:hypothetical protein